MNLFLVHSTRHVSLPQLDKALCSKVEVKPLLYREKNNTFFLLKAARPLLIHDHPVQKKFGIFSALHVTTVSDNIIQAQ